MTDFLDVLLATERRRWEQRQVELARRVAVRILHENGWSYREIGAAFGVSATQVFRLLRTPVTGEMW